MEHSIGIRITAVRMSPPKPVAEKVAADVEIICDKCRVKLATFSNAVTTREELEACQKSVIVCFKCLK